MATKYDDRGNARFKVIDDCLATEPNTLANESAVGTSAQIGVSIPKCNATRLDIDTTETLVTASPCYVLGVVGNDGNTGYTDLIDAAATGSGNTPVVRTNAADGSFVDCRGAKFNTGLCVDGESAGHDVTVFWWPQA